MKKKLNCVLLIDDSDDTNFLNRRLLTRMDITEKIHVAESGRDALDFLSSTGSFANEKNYPVPMLIFLDLNMPMMNGWEFLVEYHKLPEEQKGRIIVVMLTSSPNPEDAHQAKENEDITGFVKKPLTGEVLEKILRDYFPNMI